MKIKSLSRITKTLALVLVVASANADTVYKVAWKQDFEDTDTYLDQVRNGVYAAVNTAEIVNGDQAVLSQKTRTLASGKSSTFLDVARNGKAATTSLVFDVPDLYCGVGVTDYKVEWDWYISSPFGNDNPPYSHYQVVGNNGILATMEVPYGDNKGWPLVRDLYNGAGDKLGSLSIGNRNKEAATNTYWHHFVVYGTNGVVTLDVTDYSGNEIIKGAVLATSIDQVKTISFEMPMHSKNAYSYSAGLDDVVVSLPGVSMTFEWTGAAGDGLWGNPDNWLENGNASLNAPTSLDDVVIPAGADVVVPTAIDYKTITLGDGAKLHVLFGALGESFVIPDGVSFDGVGVAGPFATSIENGVMTATERVASTFEWVGEADAVWSGASNWRIGGLPTLVAPIATDTASFDGNATVSFTGNAEISSLEISAGVTVTLNGHGKELAGLRFFGAEDAKGGKIVLNAMNLKTVSMDSTVADPVISCSWYGDIEIAGDVTTNTIYCMSSDNKSTDKRLNIYGNISGSGIVRFMGEGHHASGVFDGRASVGLYGDNRNFTGRGIINNNSAAGRSAATFCSANAGGGAMWELVNCLYTYENKNKAGSIDSSINNSVIAFGAIEGNTVLSGTSSGLTGNVVEVGAANIDFTTWLSFTSTTAARPQNYATLKKVGSGTMTFGGVDTYPCWVTNVLAGGVWKMDNRYSLQTPRDNNGNYTDTTVVFEGGAVAFGGSFTNETGAVLDLSKYIKFSNSPIAVITDENQDVTWANALAASNVGGLTKKGEGTLTLSEKPLYTGLTTVEAGTLVVPATFTEIVYNPLSAGTISGVVPTQFAYPAGATLNGTEANKVVDGTLDISNVATVDASNVALSRTKPFVLVSATAITGYTKESLAAVELTLPEGVDPEKWVLKVMGVDGRRSLCVTGAENPLFIILK